VSQTVAASGINPATGTFPIVIPLTQATGSCTLNFTSNNINGTQTMTPVTMTVTAATGPAGTGLGTPPVVNAPTLQSASILTNGFNASAQSVIQYVFSGPVTTNGVLADFSLIGFDTARDTSNNAATTAFAALQDMTNPNAIDVSYPPQVDPASYTVAAADNTGPTNTVNNSAVIGTTGADAGLNNPLGTVPLVGSRGPTSVTTGNTTAPDLVSCAVSLSNARQIIYTFDKSVSTGTPPVPGDFGFYNAAGVLVNGNTVDPSFIGGTQVPIDFTNPVGGTEVRCSVAPQGAATGHALPNPAGKSPVSGVGGTTLAPDLTSITAVAGNSTQFDFHFDETVTSSQGVVGDYLLYLNNATQLVGQTFVNVINSNTVRVDFAPVLTQANVGNVVLGAVTTNAATSPTTLFVNTIGSEPISGIVTNGQITDGPQLQSATGTASGLSVTYTFNPQTSGLGAATAGGFFIIDNAGNPTFGLGTPTVLGNSVTVTFPATALATAKGAGVTSGSTVGVNNGFETNIDQTAIPNTSGNQNAPGLVTLTVGP
jgi:hypothetical protein